MNQDKRPGRRDSADEETIGNDEVRIGISSCLLGEEVRFDGGHKRDRFLTDTLAQFVKFVPVCPEMELGLGAPRESMHLEIVGDEVQLLTSKTGENHTDSMRRWATRRVGQLIALRLSGFILKSNSPSCGMERVKVYQRGDKSPNKNGRGLFAAELLDRTDSLPIEEEGRLHDPKTRENFFVRVFAYRRLRAFFSGDMRSMGDLVKLHNREELLLRSHDPEELENLGQLVADAKRYSRAELEIEYIEGSMRVLKKKATTRTVSSVLQNTVRHLRQYLNDRSRPELLASIEDYREGVVPLVVPLTLLRHHARDHNIEELLEQSFLDPHPKELLLRNHV